ncbi:amino acid permease-domain-containing protein [Colletotrichum phormii]|uniref:Amino acid permease-domain-containing protein n=1 Tax=Colletotrichum phormii TaxID=359342 RepID=A0AAI9ZPT7_9PEZI|nr:amino acid permease-domain-containing protein [Colletotrichum phormii]KAK1635586.1 amino acid permease-domain-containing protein [Colletotrichum phormii]
MLTEIPLGLETGWSCEHRGGNSGFGCCLEIRRQRLYLYSQSLDTQIAFTKNVVPSKDAGDLAELGHSQALSRKFDTGSLLSLAFVVLGTWSVFAQSLASGLTNGGPITILWGLCLVTFCNTCIGVSLGEMCSSMPTAMGQTYWVSRLWPTPAGRFTSYLCAWINTFGWWHLLLTLLNVISCRRDKILPVFNNFVGITFAGLFFVFGLALLISVGTKDELRFQPPSFVFGAWINRTGWSDGIVWFMGLVQSAYGLTAFDAAIHLVEEIPAPRKNIPRVIWLSIICGAATGFLFMVVCLFCIQDLEQVLDPTTGLPFMDLVRSTVGLQGAAVLIALFIITGLGQGVTVVTTASRLTWGFARDGGIPWSSYFSHVDETWKAPVLLEAIVGVSTIALTISYAIPILTLLLVGRSKLPPAEFRLVRCGAAVNWVSIVYCLITTVFFFFPAEPNPAVPDMNYAIAVFGIILLFSIGFWFIKGRQTYLQVEDIAGRVIYGTAENHPQGMAESDSKRD